MFFYIQNTKCTVLTLYFFFCRYLSCKNDKQKRVFFGSPHAGAVMQSLCHEGLTYKCRVFFVTELHSKTKCKTLQPTSPLSSTAHSANH